MLVTTSRASISILFSNINYILGDRVHSVVHDATRLSEAQQSLNSWTSYPCFFSLGASHLHQHLPKLYQNLVSHSFVSISTNIWSWAWCLTLVLQAAPQAESGACLGQCGQHTVRPRLSVKQKKGWPMSQWKNPSRINPQYSPRPQQFFMRFEVIQNST